MRLNRLHIQSWIVSLLVLMLPFCSAGAQKHKFVVVIDAGHGGHDPGAIGKISKEKNINLGVALLLGNLIKEKCPDTKVVYTRSRDVFIPLARRAEIANDVKADLFISIHTNSVGGNRNVQGASTWTLGLAKSDANLEVAKRENAVILYEDDYKTRYAGFNPNSAESYIIFEFMQDKYMSQSVHLASLVQKEFKQHGRRIDRGVHQAGFLVLKASAMPSILVELGFISSPQEERYLNSENGRKTLANSIFRAFLTYKREQEMRLNGQATTTIPPSEADSSVDTPVDTPTVASDEEVEAPKSKPVAKAKTTTSSDKQAPVFKIQILTSTKSLSLHDKQFKGLKGIEYYKENGLYKYTYGASTDYNEILRLKRSISSKIKDAFIIAFKNGKKMDTVKAINEFKKNKK